MILTEEHLLDIGFTRHEGSTYQQFSKNISFFPEYEFKDLSVTLKEGNQYVHIIYGDYKLDRSEGDILTIFSTYKQGVLTKEYIEDLLRILTEKL